MSEKMMDGCRMTTDFTFYSRKKERKKTNIAVKVSRCMSLSFSVSLAVVSSYPEVAAPN